MKNGLFKLYSNDFTKGLITAVFAAVIITLYSLISTVGFDFFKADWNMILHQVINVAASAMIGYLAKNFLTSNTGKVAGMIDTEPTPKDPII